MQVKYKGVSGIYIIKNNIDRRVYVGGTTNLYQRYHQHKNVLLSGGHHVEAMQHLCNQYGFGCFVFEILELCGKEIVLEREQFYLDNTTHLFNVLKIAGSVKGLKHSEETLKKLSDINKGKTISKDHLFKLNEGRRNKPITEENRLNYSLAKKGIKHSKEHRLKNRLAKSGSLNANARKIVDTSTGDIFTTIKEAAKANGLHYVTFVKYLNKKITIKNDAAYKKFSLI